ncbi:DUF72 domain-containing protein, partial [Rhizobium leguminosarum]
PMIADVTAYFVYARLQKGSDDIPTCYPEKDLKACAGRLETWAEGKVPDDLPLIDGDRPVRRIDLALMDHEGEDVAWLG